MPAAMDEESALPPPEQAASQTKWQAVVSNSFLSFVDPEIAQWKDSIKRSSSEGNLPYVTKLSFFESQSDDNDDLDCDQEVSWHLEHGHDKRKTANAQERAGQYGDVQAHHSPTRLFGGVSASVALGLGQGTEQLDSPAISQGSGSASNPVMEFPTADRQTSYLLARSQALSSILRSGVTHSSEAQGPGTSTTGLVTDAAGVPQGSTTQPEQHCFQACPPPFQSGSVSDMTDLHRERRASPACIGTGFGLQLAGCDDKLHGESLAMRSFSTHFSATRGSIINPSACADGAPFCGLETTSVIIEPTPAHHPQHVPQSLQMPQPVQRLAAEGPAPIESRQELRGKVLQSIGSERGNMGSRFCNNGKAWQDEFSIAADHGMRGFQQSSGSRLLWDPPGRSGAVCAHRPPWPPDSRLCEANHQARAPPPQGDFGSYASSRLREIPGGGVPSTVGEHSSIGGSRRLEHLSSLPCSSGQGCSGFLREVGPLSEAAPRDYLPLGGGIGPGSWGLRNTAQHCDGPVAAASLQDVRQSSLPEHLLGQVPRDAQGNLTSIGTMMHEAGTCRPCLFWFKGQCSKDVSCNYCHLVHDGQKSKRIRPSKRTREINRAANPLAQYQ